MRNKVLAVLGAAVISVGTVGGVVFARTINNNGSKGNPQVEIKANSINANQTTVANSANNTSKNAYQDMIKIMRDNGFKDAAKYMETGDYDAMTNYMNNLSQDDYNKMIEVMNNNGYGYMAQMMQSIDKEGMVRMHKSIGREGMTQMHKSIGIMNGSSVNGSNYNNMMGGFSQ